ncbi:MAG TPA: Gfo/Idh/MocA family oxidoreductase [Mycobacteriales bacterium]|nr:Gfo/Idh/MocA family oxidoreductase [Mycobacteriales bacterium]
MKSARIGVLGCGKVSHMYLPILLRSPAIEVAAIADADPAVAKAVSEQYQIATVVSPDGLLADPTIDIVLNLTPIAVHVGVTQAALRAGKHVYSEKSLATTVQDAQSLLSEAESRGLVLACAPDTLLGSGFQAAREALDGGRIGRALSASAAMFRSALTAPSFYTKGPTAFFDMSPYYLSALVSLLGPVTRVSGATRTWPTDEKPADTATGATIAISGTLEFAGGATASLTLSWGTGHRHEVPVLDVYGETGVIEFPNPNNFGDAAYIRGYADADRSEIPGSRQDENLPHNLRGLGVAEMVLAVQEGRAPRASGELAVHVVDLVASLVQSAEEGRRIDLTTTCQSPPPLAADVRDQLLG